MNEFRDVSAYLPLVALTKGQIGNMRKKYLQGLTSDYVVGEKDVRIAVGLAVSETDGVLGLKGKHGEATKTGHKFSRGISADIDEYNKVKVCAVIVMDADADPARVIGDAAKNAVMAIKNDLDMMPGKVEIEIGEVMTKKDFMEKCRDCGTLDEDLEEAAEMAGV